MTSTPDPLNVGTSQTRTEFVGLAPFLRMSIAGTDFLPVAQEMLVLARSQTNDANLWMNLSTAMLCLGHRDLGLTIQAQALELKRIYQLAAARQPAKIRLLMLMVPGDLAANTPLDCLLEASDIDLDFYYVTAGDPLALPIPDHDVLLVAISEAEENHEVLAMLARALAKWPQPVINAPQNIANVGREAAASLLQNVSGLLIPPTLRAPRLALQAVALGTRFLPDLFDGCDFPIILRPVGSHAGRDLDKIGGPEDVAGYLARVTGDEFYLSRFIDYSSKDGLFRKMRVALIDGKPFACHMAVSSHWMIHYVNAGMYDDAWKRDEEASFMESFDAFAQRHRLALDAIWKRTGLDYVCIDCAETADGQLLIFEADHAMVVHAMDPEERFPYKQIHMQKVKDAFRNFLLRLTAGRMPAIAA